DFPLWSPDRRMIAYRSGGPVGTQLWVKSLNSGADERVALLSGASAFVTPTSWSPDGRFLIYAQAAPTTSWDLWLLPLDNGRPSRSRTLFVGSRFNEEDGRFSPDGRFVAFTSNESGAKEVYVRAFDGGAAERPVSIGSSVLVSRGGGFSPRWRKDGKE